MILDEEVAKLHLDILIIRPTELPDEWGEYRGVKKRTTKVGPIKVLTIGITDSECLVSNCF